MNATQGIWEYEGMRRGPPEMEKCVSLELPLKGIRVVRFGECGIERGIRDPAVVKKISSFWHDHVE